MHKPMSASAKVLLVVSIIFITIGSALLWAHTGSVTVDTNAQRAANYYIMGFFYIFITSVLTLLVPPTYRPGLYLLMGGLVFEVVTRNQLISWAYSNLWRIYSQDPTRLTAQPSDNQRTAVKAMLAGAIMGHFGIVCCVVASVLKENFRLSLRGTYVTLFGWLLAIPGAICIFRSRSATLAVTAAETAVYQSAWLILDSALGIMTVQTTGVLFDNFEMVAASAVLCGTHGIFLLGDTFLLQYQRDSFSQFDGDGPILYAGGILCWLSIFAALAGAIYFFSKRHVVYYTLLPSLPRN